MEKRISRGGDFSYSAPTVTEIEVAVEQGFAITGIYNDPTFSWGDEDEDTFA